MDWEDYLFKNLIYCEDTHSFTHRLYDKIMEEKPETYKDAQDIAHIILKEMNEEFYE